MADSVEMADLRGLDVDKIAKGFAEQQYIFKSDCTVSSMTGDSIQWYSKTAGTLSASSPSVIKNVGRLSTPATLEVTWTRSTSYPKKYFVEGFISMEDIKSTDLDVLATIIRDLTLAITAAVDSDVWDVLTESQTPVNIQTFATTAIGGAVWSDATYAADIVKDVMHAKKLLFDYNYNAEGATWYLSPLDYRNVVSWLISGKGSSIPGFSSEKIKGGVVMQLLGLNLKVSNNVTADKSCIAVTKRACTFKQQFQLTAKTVEEVGIGTKIRIYEHGIAYLTDPKAVVFITDTQ